MQVQLFLIFLDLKYFHFEIINNNNVKKIKNKILSEKYKK